MNVMKVRRFCVSIHLLQCMCVYKNPVFMQFAIVACYVVDCRHNMFLCTYILPCPHSIYIHTQLILYTHVL